jgi:hypothetical protein
MMTRTTSATRMTIDVSEGQHAVHEAGGALGHAPAAAARTDAAPLAGKGNQPLLGTGVARQAGEAVGPDAAGEELAELLLHELRQAGTSARRAASRRKVSR